MWYRTDGAMGIGYSRWWSCRRSQRVASVWCMSEDLRCKENDRKSKIEGHRRVSDG